MLRTTSLLLALALIAGCDAAGLDDSPLVTANAGPLITGPTLLCLGQVGTYTFNGPNFDHWAIKFLGGDAEFTNGYDAYDNPTQVIGTDAGNFQMRAIGSSVVAYGVEYNPAC